MSRTRLRKNLSNSDLHDDNRSESDDDSSLESRVNPWSNKLHNEDFNITKKCGKIFCVIFVFHNNLFLRFHRA